MMTTTTKARKTTTNARILGIDFTSAPSRRKAIWATWGELTGDVFHVKHVRPSITFSEFEAELATPGPWVGGLDFPLSQPRDFVDAMGWPTEWRPFVQVIGAMELPEFVGHARRFRTPDGHRERFRPCDRVANACSPMKMFYIPVGRMFYRGAPRVAASGVSVWPHDVSADPRTVVEAYPALVARSVIGRTPYKGSGREAGRTALIRELVGGGTVATYGFRVDFDPDDPVWHHPDGDAIDSLLATIQAAWFHRLPHRPSADPFEGTITDPLLHGPT